MRLQTSADDGLPYLRESVLFTGSEFCWELNTLRTVVVVIEARGLSLV